MLDVQTDSEGGTQCKLKLRGWLLHWVCKILGKKVERGGKLLEKYKLYVDFHHIIFGIFLPLSRRPRTREIPPRF